MDETKKALLSIDIDTAALSQNIANAKASVADLSTQLRDMKAAGLEGTEAFNKVGEQLKKAGEEASKSKETLNAYTKSMDESKKAATDLNTGMDGLSKKHTVLRGDTEKTGKSVSDYTNNILHAVESVTPFAESLSKTAEKFKTLQEGSAKVGQALGLLKKDGDAAATNALTLTTNATNAAKGFETLKTGTEVAAGGVGSFGKALAATGISIVILAVSALMDYLKQFTPLIDATERVTAGLSGGFTALGRIVMGLVAPLQKLFTDPKQAMVDLVNFLEQNVMNRFKALGVIIEGIHNMSFKQITDGAIQLGTGVTNATDKISNFSKTIIKAGKDTYDLKGQQQELARSVESEALKTSESEAKIAELRIKAQTATAAKRREILKDIANLEAGQAKLHEDNINKGVDLAVKDVAIKRALTQQEIELIKSKGTAELEALQKQGRIYNDDVKSLSDALGKKFELRKAHADARQKLHTTALANSKKAKVDAVKDNAKTDESAKNQELHDQQELFDLKQQTLIKAETNQTKIHELQTQQNTKDLEFELQNTSLTATQKLVIQEKYHQKQLELDAAFQQTKKQNDNKANADHINTANQQANAENKINQNKLNGYKGYFSQLQGLFGKNTIAAKAAFLAQKAMAFAEVIINTQKQISAINLATAYKIAGDAVLGLAGIPLMAKDAAEGTVEVVTAIASGAIQAATIIGTALQGFAKGGVYRSDNYGGIISGPGNGTSDSINARLSNGESIINARSTEMFAPVLSAINQAGGGRAFNTLNHSNGYVLGGIFNGSTALNDTSNELATTRNLNDMAKTIALNMPRQILVVEDVQASLQNKAMLQSMSNF
jgi:hypothetical protein